MLIFHDARLPQQVIEKLQKIGDCIPFLTQNITYDPIAGHPDIFLCQVDQKLIIAPNTPEKVINKLVDKNIDFQFGESFIGGKNSVAYNVVVTNNYIIHNRNYTDKIILQQQGGKKYIHVNQAYIRCSMLPLVNDSFLTSDQGIAKVLLHHGLSYCCVKAREIILPGYKHGFIGGCMGVYGDKVYIIGSLDYHSDGGKIRNYLQSLNYQIVELYKGPLFDGGSLFFI